jgi:hypothetical protein
MARPKVFGVDFVFGDLAVAQLAHQRGGAQADLVHAVAAIHHHGVLGAQALQRTHLDAHQIGVEHAHQDVGRAAGLVSGPRMLKMVLTPSSRAPAPRSSWPGGGWAQT